jgi:PAS domain S-box-containing protein
MNLSIKTKISVVIALLIIAVTAVNAAYFIRHSHLQVESVMIRKGTALSSSLSKAAEEGLASESLDLLKKAEYIVNEQEVVLSQIYSTTWNAVDAHPLDKLNDPPLQEAKEHFKNLSSPFYKKSNDLYDFYAPVLFKPGKDSEAVLIGYVRLTLTSSGLKEETRKTLIHDIPVSIVIALLSMIALNVLLNRFVITRLLKLRRAISAFQHGGVREDVSVTSDDEIGELIASFNQMTATISHDKAELYKASDEIYSVLQDWESTFDTITDMITIHDKDFNIIRANKAAEAILKLPLLDKLGDTKCFSYYHGTEKPPEGCPSCACLKTGKPALFELFEPHLNKFIEIRAIPRFDKDNNFTGLIHIVRDITEQKKFQEAILNERDFLQLAINSLPGIFYLFDRSGRFMRWNKNFEAVTGYSAEEISAMSPLDLFEGTDRILIKERIEEVFTKGYSEAEAFLRSKLGRHTPYFFNGHVIEADGKECLIGMGIDITERKRTESFLIEAEERYRQLFESAADAIFILDKKGNFLNVNKIAYERLGYSKEEMLAMNIRELDPPEYAVRVPDRLNKIQRNGMAVFESAHKRKDGTVMPVEVNSRLFNYMGQEVFFSVIRDITERKRMEEEIQRNNVEFQKLYYQFQSLLNAIPDSLTLQDRDLTILWANKGAADLLGMQGKKLAGERCYKLWHDRSEPCEPCPVVESFQTGKPANLTVKTPDSKIWDLRTVPLTDGRGNVINVIEVGRDITEHRKMEEHLRQAQKMESVGQLAGGVAHDFNNILTAIVNHGYILKKRFEDDKDAADSIEKILILSQNAAKITQELLIFSRKQPLEMASLDLNDFITGTVRLLRNFIPENVEIKTELTDASPLIMADKNQMDQIMMNLSSNAADAMPYGGALTIKTEHVYMDNNFITLHGYGSEGRYAFLSISDTGVGMDKDTLHRAFELFFTTKEVGKGTGLGLSIVYGIVKKHNGYINVYSEPGIGTTFNIYLPEIEAEAGSAPEVNGKYLMGKGETILYAEDESGVRESMIRILEHFNYKVIAAVDGKEAVEKFQSHKDDIRLLLFDVVMPKMGGQKAFQEIRAAAPELKVIFTSGYTNDEISMQEVREEGVFFMLKPLYPEKLLSKIRSVMDS